jgi:hypothetical protein
MPPNEIQTEAELVGEMEPYKRLRAGCSWHTESFKTWNRKRMLKGSGLCYVHANTTEEHVAKAEAARAYGAFNGDSFDLPPLPATHVYLHVDQHVFRAEKRA